MMQNHCGLLALFLAKTQLTTNVKSLLVIFSCVLLKDEQKMLLCGYKMETLHAADYINAENPNNIDLQVTKFNKDISNSQPKASLITYMLILKTNPILQFIIVVS